MGRLGCEGQSWDLSSSTSVGFLTACGLVEEFCTRCTWDGAGTTSEEFQASATFLAGWTVDCHITVESGSIGLGIIGLGIIRLEGEDRIVYALDVWCKCLALLFKHGE